MILDTSAVLAILFEEPEAQAMTAAIAVASQPRIAAPTLVEAAAVMHARKGPQGEIALDALLRRLEVEVAPMSEEAAAEARNAYARFGRGVGSPGVLNYGDCLAYGVARALGEPLLFKGSDFSQTDMDAAAY